MSHLARAALVACSISLFYPAGLVAAPSIAKPETNYPVTITDNGDTWTLDNGIIKANINKRTARMRSLVYKDIETMGRNGGGVWEQTPELAPELIQTVTID